MAGTFGYEAEHYDLSMRVGELSLFPFIRRTLETDPDLVFLASGSACRLQIEQGVHIPVTPSACVSEQVFIKTFAWSIPLISA